MGGRRHDKTLLLGLLLLANGAGAGTVLEPRLQVGLEGRYDDDALLRHDQADAPVRGEVLSKVTAQGGVHLQNRVTEGEVWYAPDLQLRYFSGSVRVDHRAGLDVRHRLSPRSSVAAELRGWRVSDPTSLPRTGMGRSLSPVLYGTGLLSGQTLLTRRLEGELRYRLEGTQYLDFDTPPGAVHAPSLELRYALGPRAQVGAEYRFQYFIYGPERATAHSPAAAFYYELARRTRLTLRAGPVLYEGEGAGVAPRVHAQLSRSFEYGDLGLQAGQDLLGATGASSAAVWAQYAGVHGGAPLSRRLRFFVGAYGFRNGPAPGGPSQWLSTSTEAGMAGYAIGGGLEWSLTRHLLVQGQVDRIAQVGTYGPVADLSRNVAAVRLMWRSW